MPDLSASLWIKINDDSTQTLNFRSPGEVYCQSGFTSTTFLRNHGNSFHQRTFSAFHLYIKMMSHLATLMDCRTAIYDEEKANLFGTLSFLGYSRRKELREIAEAIDNSNRRLPDVTLGQVCSANLVVLDVACIVCSRRGRYRITRLIDRHQASMQLSELRHFLSADCPKQGHTSFFDRCGAYFPGWDQKFNPK